MTKNDKNISNIEVTGFQQICGKLKTLEEENEQLKKDNKVLGNELTYFKELCADLEDKINRQTRMINGLKINNSGLTLERNNLLSEIQDMKQTRKYLTSEEAGRRFAQELLGGA